MRVDPEVVIRETAMAVGEPGQRTPKLSKQYRKARRPEWLGKDDDIAKIYDRQEEILARGEVRWCAMVHANETMFTPGDNTSGAQVVYAPGGNVKLGNLVAAAERCFALKGTQPDDPDERRLANMLTNEMERALDWPIPPQLAQGKALVTTIVMLPREFMPGRLLATKYFPILADPQTKLALLIPGDFWEANFRKIWQREADAQLERWKQHQAAAAEDTQAELAKLKKQYPNSATHPSRTRPSRWFLLVLGLLLIGLAALCWRLPNVPADRSQMFSLAIGAVGGLLAIGGVALPGSWAAVICEIFVGGNSIDSVLGWDIQSMREKSSSLWVEALVLVAINVLIGGAFWLLELGATALAVGVLAPTILWGLSIHYRNKFRHAQQYDLELEKVLTSRGYSSENLAHAAQYLKLSFLHHDLALELKSFWVSFRRGDVLYWGRYVCGGNELSSGIYCGVQFTERPTATVIGQVMTGVGTVYFDNRTETLFGTLRPPKGSKFVPLAGIAWQYVAGSLVCRLDHELLAARENETNRPTSQSAERLVEYWEGFCEMVQRQLRPWQFDN